MTARPRQLTLLQMSYGIRSARGSGKNPLQGAEGNSLPAGGRTPVTDDIKGRVSDKDKPVKPEERQSVLEKMKMRKKEIDQKERAERSRGYRVIKHYRDEPSL